MRLKPWLLPGFFQKETERRTKNLCVSVVKAPAIRYGLRCDCPAPLPDADQHLIRIEAGNIADTAGYFQAN